MRALPLIALLLLSACISMKDFAGGEFQCQPNSGGSNGGNNGPDEDQDYESCPGGAWCEAKRLSTGGHEGGNICVQMGTHHCAGMACPAGERCSSLGDQSASCVPCPAAGPCDPLTDSNGGGGGGGGGGENTSPCGGDSCPGQVCLGGSCSTACTVPSSGPCAGCRFVSNTSLSDGQSGGACFSGSIGLPCSPVDCPSGQGCAIFALADAGLELRCAAAGGDRNSNCSSAQGCSSGICIDGRCRDACRISAQRTSSCSSCDGTRGGFANDYGYCR